MLFTVASSMLSTVACSMLLTVAYRMLFTVACSMQGSMPFTRLTSSSTVAVERSAGCGLKVCCWGTGSTRGKHLCAVGVEALEAVSALD